MICRHWELNRRGCDLGARCPRTVNELLALLKKVKVVDEPWPLPEKATWAMCRVASPSVANTETSPSGGKVLLQIEDLSHVYKNGHTALEGITATIYEGDYLAIVGQNGAGKSTFCKHLNKLLNPTRGRILYKGANIASMVTEELAEQIGYVFQNPDHLIFSRSVLEEVTYGLKIRGVPEKERNDRAIDVLRFVELEQYSNVHPFSLSKGLRQRLAVASILVLQPEVLVIDEPTTGQDWQGTQNMLALVDQLHDRGHTIIVIT